MLMSPTLTVCGKVELTTDNYSSLILVTTHSAPSSINGTLVSELDDGEIVIPT